MKEDIASSYINLNAIDKTNNNVSVQLKSSLVSVYFLVKKYCFMLMAYISYRVIYKVQCGVM